MGFLTVLDFVDQRLVQYPLRRACQSYPTGVEIVPYRWQAAVTNCDNAVIRRSPGNVTGGFTLKVASVSAAGLSRLATAVGNCHVDQRSVAKCDTSAQSFDGI